MTAFNCQLQLNGLPAARRRRCLSGARQDSGADIDRDIEQRRSDAAVAARLAAVRYDNVTANSSDRRCYRRRNWESVGKLPLEVFART